MCRYSWETTKELKTYQDKQPPKAYRRERGDKAKAVFIKCPVNPERKAER